MNEIQIFSNPEFGDVRTLEINGEAWFVGKDVAMILGYSNASKAVTNHVDDEDKQFVMDDNEKQISPFAVFAVMKNDEIVNIGNFTDYDIAEIIEILLDIFAGDKKNIFNVNLEEYGIQSFLELLKYVTVRDYPTAVKSLKESLQNGELDVSFS